MKSYFATLLEKVKDNPAAKALAIVAFAVWGGGATLSEVPIEPWGTLVQGIGAALALAAGAVVAFSKKKPDEPPKQ